MSSLNVQIAEVFAGASASDASVLERLGGLHVDGLSAEEAEMHVEAIRAAAASNKQAAAAFALLKEIFDRALAKL